MMLACFRRPRLQLDPEAYKQLCQQVLRRDRWRCQQCGSRTNLQVHHIRLRSHEGDDAEKNLITLCSQCHRVVHTMPAKNQEDEPL